MSIRIQLAPLQAAEEQLDRRGRVAVGTREDQLEPKGPEYGPCLFTRVVRGIVPKEHGVLLPPRRLMIELLGQGVEEEDGHT